MSERSSFISVSPHPEPTVLISEPCERCGGHQFTGSVEKMQFCCCTCGMLKQYGARRRIAEAQKGQREQEETPGGHDS